MIRLSMRRSAGLLMLLISAGQATAQTPPRRLTPVEQAERWGLIGTWKVDCAAPTTRANPAFTYVVRDGRLYTDRDFGDARASGDVPDVLPGPHGTTEVIVSFPSPREVSRLFFIKDASGRKRLVFVTDFATGPQPAWEAWQAAHPDQTRWQTRCR